MKKLLLAILIAIAFCGCKKNYTCECKVTEQYFDDSTTYQPNNYSTTYNIKTSKRKGKYYCSDTEYEKTQSYPYGEFKSKVKSDCTLK